MRDYLYTRDGNSKTCMFVVSMELKKQKHLSPQKQNQLLVLLGTLIQEDGYGGSDNLKSTKHHREVYSTYYMNDMQKMMKV